MPSHCCISTNYDFLAAGSRQREQRSRNKIEIEKRAQKRHKRKHSSEKSCNKKVKSNKNFKKQEEDTSKANFKMGQEDQEVLIRGSKATSTSAESLDNVSKCIHTNKQKHTNKCASINIHTNITVSWP